MRARACSAVTCSFYFFFHLVSFVFFTKIREPLFENLPIEHILTKAGTLAFDGWTTLRCSCTSGSAGSRETAAAI